MFVVVHQSVEVISEEGRCPQFLHIAALGLHPSWKENVPELKSLAQA